MDVINCLSVFCFGFFWRPRYIGLTTGNTAPAPSTCDILQTRLRVGVQNKPQTHHRSCSRLGDARVSAQCSVVVIYVGGVRVPGTRSVAFTY
jgi:hypothetical protein